MTSESQRIPGATPITPQDLEADAARRRHYEAERLAFAQDHQQSSAQHAEHSTFSLSPRQDAAEGGTAEAAGTATASDSSPRQQLRPADLLSNYYSEMFPPIDPDPDMLRYYSILRDRYTLLAEGALTTHRDYQAAPSLSSGVSDPALLEWLESLQSTPSQTDLSKVIRAFLELVRQKQRPEHDLNKPLVEVIILKFKTASSSEDFREILFAIPIPQLHVTKRGKALVEETTDQLTPQQRRTLAETLHDPSILRPCGSIERDACADWIHRFVKEVTPERERSVVRS